MIFDFPQFFGKDPDTKSWAGLLISSISSAFSRLVEFIRSNVVYSTDDSTAIVGTYTEIVSVDLKSSGSLVKVEFGSNADVVLDLKLLRNAVDEKEILASSGSSVWIDADHEEGVITYSLQAKGGGAGSATPDFTDDFNRANETLSANTDWEEVPSGYSAKVLTIVSNEATQAGTGSQFGTNPCFAIPTATYNFGTEYWCRTTVVSLPDSGNTHLGLAVECEATGGGTINDSIFAVPRNDGSIDLQTISGGSYSTSGTGVITGGDVLGVHIDASGDVTVYVNGSSVMTELATGTPGFQPGYCGTGATITGASAVFDDFEAGDGAFPTVGSSGTSTDTYLIATELKGI